MSQWKFYRQLHAQAGLDFKEKTFNFTYTPHNRQESAALACHVSRVFRTLFWPFGMVKLALQLTTPRQLSGHQSVPKPLGCWASSPLTDGLLTVRCTQHQAFQMQQTLRPGVSNTNVQHSAV